MSSTSIVSATNTHLAALTQVESILKIDLLTAAGPPVLAFLTSVAKNSSVTNVAAQWIVLQAALLATLPQLEATVINQLATWLSQKLQALIPAPTA